MKKLFKLPTRPFKLVDAINRMAAATGSPRYAMAASNADYNGHRVDFIEPNSYKTQWTCGYQWSGFNTIGRGTLEDCLRAAKREYDRGALGASASVTVDNDSDAALCIEYGFQEWSEEKETAHSLTWRTPLFALVNEALDDDRRGRLPGATGILLQCNTVAEYHERVRAHREALRAK